MPLVVARVLVVEEATHFVRLRATLADAGFSVRVAAHGADALLLLHREIANDLILALVLPLVNGIEALRTTRRQPCMADVPAVVVTGSATTAHDLRSFCPCPRYAKTVGVGERDRHDSHTVKPRQARGQAPIRGYENRTGS
jgi:CheY-like chemotaxis protein